MWLGTTLCNRGHPWQNRGSFVCDIAHNSALAGQLSGYRFPSTKELELTSVPRDGVDLPPWTVQAIHKGVPTVQLRMAEWVRHVGNHTATTANNVLLETHVGNRRDADQFAGKPFEPTRMQTPLALNSSEASKTDSSSTAAARAAANTRDEM